MQKHERTGLVTTKRIAGLLVAAGLAIGGEAAADGYVNGPVAKVGVSCDGVVQDGQSAFVGYYVDPVAEIPKLGEPVMIHAVVYNTSSCAQILGIEFLQLPPGMRFDSNNPVACFLGATRLTRTSECLQTPVRGQYGGSFFGSKKVPAGVGYEIQVPVVFDQMLAGETLEIGISSVWGPLLASVGVFAPFDAATSPLPAPPPPLPTPTPPPAPTPQPKLKTSAIGDDIALLGSSLAGNTLPVAFSNDDGTFTVTTQPVGAFAAQAREPNVQRLSGDFNGDGLTDFALVGGAGWQSIPVAFANNTDDGTFTVKNEAVQTVPGMASVAGVKVVTGDFNRDQRTDIAVISGISTSTIAIAWSKGDGTFGVTNEFVPGIGVFAAFAGARPLIGDFNRDGMADIALVGGAGMTTIPVAFSYGDGSFLFTNNVVGVPFTVVNGSIGPGANFATMAAKPGAQVVTGDFNSDGFTDLALAGGTGATTIPVALSYGNGSFQFLNNFVHLFPAWATTSGAKLLTGDFNGDGRTDLALTGGAGWNTIPVALNVASGTFVVINNTAGAFGSFASTQGVRIVAGDYNGDGRMDIALTGGAGWASIPVAFNVGIGAFAITNMPVVGFASFASEVAASALRGRVD